MRRYRIAQGLIGVLIIYTLSIGPVFACYARSYYDHGGPPMPRVLYQMYRPLFLAVPGPTSQYLKIWGVSEIEAFFITDPPQDCREVEEGASRAKVVPRRD